MFVISATGNLVNLALITEVWLDAQEDGMVRVRADGHYLTGAVSVEEGKKALAQVLAKQEEMNGSKLDRTYVRRLEKEREQFTAQIINSIYHDLIRFEEWKYNRVWYRRLWQWIARRSYAFFRPRRVR